MAKKFLPALDETLQPPAPNGDRNWTEHEGGLGVLAKYSASLAVSHNEVPAERLKSVPSPWARVLLFEQALYNTAHPAHRQVKGEWRGLLGLIGLAPHLGIEVTARAVDLAASAGGVLHRLREMAPRGDDPILWDRAVLLFADGHSLGGTSPRTLVFTGIRRLATGRVPFQENGRLIDPLAHYRERGDRTSLAILAEWLQRTTDDLGDGANLVKVRRLLGNLPGGTTPRGAEVTPSAGSNETGAVTSRAELLLRSLDNWRGEAEQALTALGRPAGDLIREMRTAPIAAAFPDRHPAQPVFALLKQAYPAELVGGDNDLRVLGVSAVANPGVAGVLYRGSHRFTGTVVLPRGMGREVRNGRFVLPTTPVDLSATFPDLGALFERKLIPVRGITADHSHALHVNGIHYLYPFKPEILSHLTSEHVAAWTSVSGERATGIKVRLTVPLENGLRLAYEQDFTGSDVYGQEDVATPQLAVWPDFESADWNHYFYVERHVSRGGLRFEPFATGQIERFSADDTGLRWGRSQEPIRAWTGTFASTRGLLLGRSSRRVAQTGAQWDVSIDFGSTHTRVFRSAIGAGGSQSVYEVPLKARATAVLGSDATLPYQFFVTPNTLRGSDAEPPTLVWLPLDRPLTRDTSRQWLPPDGVMFWGVVDGGRDSAGLRGNLKWHRDDVHERAAFHSFASQSYLAIAAEAAAEGATVRSLVTAYPSVLPRELRTRHRNEWGELRASYGVQVRESRSESDALAAYYVAEQRATTATNLLAVDVGGSTSDLTVWTRGRRAHGDSIRMAGDILSRLVALDENARSAISAALSRPPFNRDVRWDLADPTRNGMVLNSILRSISSDDRLRSDRTALAANLYDGPGSAGERVLAHVGYLFATVSFLLGLMVRRYTPEQEQREPRFEIRFAGKGSEFLHWLDAFSDGASRSLPAAFFRAGLGEQARDAEVHVYPPGDHVKQEVGRGLLWPAVSDDVPADDRVTFIGETGYSGGESVLEWSTQLDFDVLRRMPIPQNPVPLEQLHTLRAFVAAFDGEPTARKVARALGIKADLFGRDLRDRIHSQLFGVGSAWRAVHDQNALRAGDALLEPFFVTEAKALLEYSTGNAKLFAS